jgi:hypothetical protein
MPNRFFLVLRGATAAIAIWFILCFIGIALLSLPYPYHLEWMEGQMIDVVARVVEGKPLYMEPTIEYVPFLYTPLYFYVSAFVAWFTGVDFLPARLVSFLSALGCGAIIYAWIRKETPSHLYALIGAGLFFATYKLSGRWLDVARNDSFSLFLTLAGLFFLFHYHQRKVMIATGALLAAAFFTKQSTLIMTLPPLLAWVCVEPKKWPAIAVFGGIAAIGMAWMNGASDGWFWYYVYEVPASHKWKNDIAPYFWGREMLRPTGLAFILSGFAIWQIYIRDKKKAIACAALFAGCVGGSFLMRLHSYSYLNVLMPAYAALALFSGLSLQYLAPRLWRRVSPNPVILIFIQLSLLVYNPAPMVPSQESREKGDVFLGEIAKIDGDIFMPELQFVQTRVGKKSYAYGMAAFDIMRANVEGKETIKGNLRLELAKALRAQRFAAIMPGRLFPLRERKGYYVPGTKLDYPQELVTGAFPFLKTQIYTQFSASSLP